MCRVIRHESLTSERTKSAIVVWRFKLFVHVWKVLCCKRLEQLWSSPHEWGESFTRTLTRICFHNTPPSGLVPLTSTSVVPQGSFCHQRNSRRLYLALCRMLFRSTLINEHFWTKGQARAAVSFLAVVKMLEKKYIDHRLNPRRTKDRLVVSLYRLGSAAAVTVGVVANTRSASPLCRPCRCRISFTTTGLRWE